MTPNPYTSSAPMIAASILSADFSKLGAEITDALNGGADFIHLDIMDGHFVPNITFGPPVVAKVRPITPAYYDVHLMITDPMRYAPAFVKAGANNITFQVEAVADPAATAQEIKRLGCHAGITLKPGTPIETIWPALELVDLVLIMSVEPGFGGQKFMPDMLDKVRKVKERIREDQRIEIDGGIHNETIRAAREAGVDWFVIGSALFDPPDRKAAITQLRNNIG